MTIEVPLFSQGGTYSARVTRQLLANLLTEGVLTGFAVSQRGAGANFSVDVTAGQAVVTGDDESNQGRYLTISTATENVVVSAAPGSNSRYDIVVLQVNDPTAGGSAGDDWEIAIIAGTPAGSPTVPAVPDSALHIATIGPIATATASITNSLIADTRTYATLTHDVVDDANAVRLGTNTHSGSTIVRRDAGGRYEAENPSTALQVVNKQTLDAAGSVTQFGDTIMRRDSDGRSKTAAPAVDADLTNKVYVDTKVWDTANIADDAIATAKILDVNVTNAKIATAPGGSSGSVRWRKLGDMVTVYVGASGNVTGVNIPAGYRPAENVQSVGSATSLEGVPVRVTTAGALEYLSGTWQTMSGAWSFVFQYPAA